MRNILTKIAVVCGAIISFTSCKKYLEVTPQEKVIESMVFSDLAGASRALNGVYLQMSANSLYGKNLTMGVLDVMAQYHNTNSQHLLTKFQLCDYSAGLPRDYMDAIWSSAYVSVVNLNQFLVNLEAFPGIMPDRIKDILKGEATGLRAMLHFDMLRLFGPMYTNADSTKGSIPYYRVPTTEISPLLPANQAIDSVLDDLRLAESLLANDPIIDGGINTGTIDDGYEFFRNRNQRMNYFAVKGLQARVHLYRRDYASALEAAKVVLEVGEPHFPWTSHNAILDAANPDRIFSSELIFAGMSSKLYETNSGLFAPDLGAGSILAPLENRLRTFYESNENDYRHRVWWVMPSTAKSYKTFYKYTDVVDKGKNFRFLIPLIRKSEMYYIAAECETDPVKAFEYLNAVRYNRGLTDLPTTANKNTELQKEYQKEFFGEGQLFFYYKRRGVTSVPNPTAASGNFAMNSAKYVVPLPQSESLYR